MDKANDRFLWWVIAGSAGVLSRDLWSLVAKGTGLAKFYVWHIGADIFLTPSQVNTVAGNIVGILTDIVTGSFLGVLFGLFIEWRGWTYYWLKGWGIGMLAWLFLFGILFHMLPQTHSLAPDDAVSIISSFIGHSIFGLGMAFTYKKLAGIGVR